MLNLVVHSDTGTLGGDESYPKAQIPHKNGVGLEMGETHAKARRRKGWAGKLKQRDVLLLLREEGSITSRGA